MIYQGFCGPSNPSQSLIANCERTINWYPERVEAAFAPTGAALYPVPGFESYLTVTDVGARAFLAIAGRAFMVMGGGFYEVFATQTATLRGPVAQDNNPATISYNGIGGGQLFITSGGNGYIYDMSTNAAPTVVLTGEATMGGMINSRFLAFAATTGTVRGSAINDGLTWPTDVAFDRSQAADPWKSMIVRPPEIWLIGEHTGEVWYDSGAFPQPFAPIGGALFPYGTPAAFSVGEAGDYILWPSQSKAGLGPIVAARGYSPQPISNAAVDTAIARYARASTTGLSDAEVLVYADEGHLWSVFNFPGQPSWAADLKTGQWHERAKFVGGQFESWAPRVHAYAFNKHLVGDRGTGRISEMAVTFGSEADGTAIRRVRVAPPLYAKYGERLTVSSLRVLVEAGLGIAVGQGSDPQVMLRTSGDAKRWSSERLASAGKLGEYDRDCAWQQLGSSTKLFVPEISVSDPIPWRIAGAEFDGAGFQQLSRAA